MEQTKAGRGWRAAGDDEFAADPDVVGIPDGADDGAGRALVPKPASPAFQAASLNPGFSHPLGGLSVVKRQPVLPSSAVGDRSR